MNQAQTQAPGLFLSIVASVRTFFAKKSPASVELQNLKYNLYLILKNFEHLDYDAQVMLAKPLLADLVGRDNLDQETLIKSIYNVHLVALLRDLASREADSLEREIQAIQSNTESSPRQLKELQEVRDNYHELVNLCFHELSIR